MKLSADYVVVGSGLTGATIARLLSDAGREVVVLERRRHLGGNVNDHFHPSGIRVHTYGPHYFRTNCEAIWEYVNRFSEFYPYTAELKSYVDGQYENWPIAGSYIRSKIGPSWEAGFKGAPGDFEEASLAIMPGLIYERFVKGYSEKQWGVPARALSRGLAKRFDVREDDEPRLMRHKHQGIPADGYGQFMVNMLAGIPAILNLDFLQAREDIRARKLLVFTGPIDEYFGCRLGHLAYRGQRREHSFLANVEFAQPCGQVNNPDPANGAFIRTLEWKHMMPPQYAGAIRGTVLTREFPFSPFDSDQFEYPFPDEQNAQLYQQYRALAAATPHVWFCGRLGEYRYYDMDQAIGRAMELAGEMLDRPRAAATAPTAAVQQLDPQGKRS